MKKLKLSITLIALLLCSAHGYAQSSVMKDPVSHVLKNGMTIVTAENKGASKVYVNLSSETVDAAQAEKATVQEVMTIMLNQQLNTLDNRLSYSNKGVNLAACQDSLESALNALCKYTGTLTFNQETLVKAKAAITKHLAARDKYFPESVNEKNLAKLSLEDIKAYYTEISKPEQMVLTIAGNITPVMARKFAMGDQLKAIAR